MILANVTFTGADDEVDIQRMYDLSYKYPYIEWGILWYPKKMGMDRYPTKEWIRKFLDNKPSDVNTSLHICGIDAFNFGCNVGESEIWDYFDGVNRIQLNFPILKMKLDDVIALLQKGNNDFIYAVNRFHAIDPGRYVIVQANNGNKILNACLEEQPYIEFLFDASRGSGKEILEYPKPISRKYNGYAGGFTPNNILIKLNELKKVLSEKDDIWVDMETGIRTDNKFDFDKVQSVLNLVDSIALCEI